MGGKKQKPKPKYKPAKIRVKPSEPRLVVFISSLMGKMKGERDTAYRTIDSFPITRPWAFEYTSASSQNVDDAYLSKVRTCDIFLMILGKDYSEPVVLEYRTAIESRKPTLIFVTAGEKDEKQTEFIDSLPPKYAPYTDSERP